MSDQLKDLTREQLNAAAAEAGVENPEALANRAAVIEAIENANPGNQSDAPQGPPDALQADDEPAEAADAPEPVEEFDGAEGTEFDVDEGQEGDEAEGDDDPAEPLPESLPIEVVYENGDWLDPYSGDRIAVANDVNPANHVRRIFDVAVRPEDD